MSPDLNDAGSFYLRMPSCWELFIFGTAPLWIGVILWLYWTRISPVLPFVVSYWFSKKKGRASDPAENESD